MKTTICILLLVAFSVDTAEARRSRDRHSYRFYKNFYEEHKNDRPQRRAPVVASWDNAKPLAYADCEAVIIDNAWTGGRKIIKWLCLNMEEKE